jgi:hypothetical protein
MLMMMLTPAPTPELVPAPTMFDDDNDDWVK